MAALYTAGIVRNHPFVDGNKRTGFVIGVLFLELHGFDFKASEADATQAVMALAAGTLDEAGYAAWLRENAKRKRGEPVADGNHCLWAHGNGSFERGAMASN